MTGAAATPSGAPLSVLVEGLLDGRTSAPDAVHRAAAALGQCGAGEFVAEVTGGRFTLLPRAAQVRAGGFDEAAQARFLEALQAVLRAAAPGSVESNLRCRMLHVDEVTETLFVVRGDRIEAVTRRRPRTPDDAALLAPAAAPRLRRRETLLLGALAVVLAILFAWQTGWIERVYAAPAGTLRVDTGPFGPMLAVQAHDSWGDYVVELRRGPEYPTTAKELTERRDRQQGLAERAACELVGSGGDVFVQLLDEAGQVLAEARVELRPLLVDAGGTAEALLPGRRHAAALRLSLSGR
ncbi:MAG TPA: hypothetical protein VFZ65_20530 [Planctomycetota bacterium]|nr:hypothetical protein [Planctomycetota bacterium]